MNGSYELIASDCSIELDKIKQWIDVNKLHTNVQYLVSDGVIKASGTIESIVKQMIFDCISINCSDEAIQYLTRHIIESSYNPSTGQIEKLLSEVNSVWATTFQTAIKSSQQKNDLNSLVKLRNNFAQDQLLRLQLIML